MENTPSGPGGMIDFILLPYAALAVAILLVLLLLALGRWLPDESTKLQKQWRAKPAADTAALARQRQAASQALRRGKSKEKASAALRQGRLADLKKDSPKQPHAAGAGAAGRHKTKGPAGSAGQS